jgi:hypothetical protein
MSAPRLMALGCLPCVGCGVMPKLEHDSYMGFPGIVCHHCYDGDAVGFGPVLAEVVEFWNEDQRDRLPAVSP